MNKYQEIIEFIKSLYPNQYPIPLHAPVFLGNEKKYLLDCIDSTFVSYIGKYVIQFEELTAKYTGAKYAIAIVNGTAALQIALKIAGVDYGDEVITQPLTFVATANAIEHCGAKPVFVDVDSDTMGLSPEKLEYWLKHNTKPSKLSKHFSKPINQLTNRPITAIVPMHTFGFPCRIEEIIDVANKYNLPVIEDSAESLGSFFKEKHTGTFGLAGILSYNGNKTITTGGGGIILTDSEEFAQKVKHITTTAKVPHQWEYIHDDIGYNYRMTNVTAALGVAQMENIEMVLNNKRETAKAYRELFRKINYEFVDEKADTKANFWLNSIKLSNREERDSFLTQTNFSGVMTRPIWRLMSKLNMFKNSPAGNIDNSINLENTIVNIPSGYRY
ncbi:MAG: LegC family aminotransferase [Ignavibacteriaceae bacterium]